MATKTEDGKAFPSAAYAYVPDPKKPSTWKLRLWASPGGGPDANIVGAAIAALGKGFRGQKVQIPASVLGAVKAKVRAAWKKANPKKKPSEMPSVIRESVRQVDEDGTADLLEFVDSRGLRPTVDREAGMIRGVKVLGLQSRNGRTYPVGTLRAAVGLYEGKAVNVDHADGHGDSRSYRDRIGKLTAVQVREDGLYADLHYNPQHALAEQLAWDAEHAPENVGLSHDVRGKVSRQNDSIVVESIETVRSVDLVAEPATTRGLFESLSLQDGKEESMSIDLKEATLTELKEHRPELLTEYKAELAEADDVKAKDAELKTLREKLQAAEATITKAKQDAELVAELQEAKLDPTDPKVCPVFFLEQLRQTEKVEDRKAIIEDRKRLVEAVHADTKPKSTFAGGTSDNDAKPFEKGHLIESCRRHNFTPVFSG